MSQEEQSARTVPAGERVIEALRAEVADLLTSTSVELGDAVAIVAAGNIKRLLATLRDSSNLAFDFLADITAVDWMDQRPERFEVVYHLLSLKFLHRLRIKVAISEDKPAIDSVVELWKGANFLEREVYDMFGIIFTGHPDLRRILLYEEFVGHPLRKDYPVQGKQPRIPMRAPEVKNTALDMRRPTLVSIKKRIPAGQQPRNHEGTGRNDTNVPRNGTGPVLEG